MLHIEGKGGKRGEGSKGRIVKSPGGKKNKIGFFTEYVFVVVN